MMIELQVKMEDYLGMCTHAPMIRMLDFLFNGKSLEAMVGGNNGIISAMVVSCNENRS